MFSIRGLELEAKLDPEDENAFVTGLTFVQNPNDVSEVVLVMNPITESDEDDDGNAVGNHDAGSVHESNGIGWELHILGKTCARGCARAGASEAIRFEHGARRLCHHQHQKIACLIIKTNNCHNHKHRRQHRHLHRDRDPHVHSP